MVAYRNRKSKRRGYAFEDIKLDGSTLFTGGASSRRQTQCVAVQKALVEALIKAKDTRIRRIMILSNDRRLTQICNYTKKPSWQAQTFTLDLLQLQQQGLITHVLFVPKIVISNVLELAVRATTFPIHFCRLYLNPL